MELEIASGFLNYADLWHRVFSYIIYPQDEVQRRGYMAKAFAVAVSEIDKFDQPADCDVQFFNRIKTSAFTAIYRDFVELGGGFASLGPGLDQEVEWRKLERELTMTAEILFTIRAIDGHSKEASLNKALFVISDKKQKNPNDLKKAWAKHKNVSHLALAMFSRDYPELDLVNLGVFLTIARDFQRFGTTFIPYNTKNPLLKLGEIWTVPDDLPLPELRITCQLDNEGVERLRAYRAPRLG